MENTIYQGETFLCDLNAYRANAPSRGDVVVFQHGDTVLAKRLIGLPGDRIEGRDGKIQVNGAALNEPYAQYTGPSYPERDTFGPVVVNPGEIFLLGDNRNNSLDSRMDEFGAVHLSDIRCKAVSILRSEHGREGQPIH